MEKPALPADHESRREIQERLDETMLVEAAAGTGKTTSMIARMVALLREGKCEIESMAAITFTRKAAAELRSRFQVALERAAREAEGEDRERLSRAVQNIHRCFIGTIHSFCARLLRERPIEAGVPLGFGELEPGEDRLLRRQAWRQYVAEVHASESSLLSELDELGLHIDQLETTFLTLADYPDVDEWPADNIELGELIKPRDELREYVCHMEQLAATFPDERGTDKLMDRYEEVVRLARNRDLQRPLGLMQVMERVAARAHCVQKCWPGGRTLGRAERDRWDDFATRVAKPLVRRWYAKRYRVAVDVVQRAVAVYDRLRHREGQLNYQDLLMSAAKLLRGQPQVRKYFRRRFTHLLVDEFQDTDPVQAEVMMLLAADSERQQRWRKCRPVPGSLFVVGDPKQSIYRFRRADIVTYNEVKSIITRCGGVVVSLTTNFRTTESVLEWGNDIFASTFPAEATRHAPAAASMQVGRQGGGAGALTGVRVLSVPSHCSKKEDAVAYEADLIARTIRDAIDRQVAVPRTVRELQEGRSAAARADDFLIITYRKNHLALYAAALQRLAIPHEVTGGSSLPYLPELALLRDCLRAIAEPDNPVALVAVLRGELFGFSDRQLYLYRQSGGRFLFRSRVPEDMPSDLHARYDDAFERLRTYDGWFRRMPLVPAIERVAADLGLTARALTSPGGDVQAGTLAKTFQCLRNSAAELQSLADVVEHLDVLLEGNSEFDGLSARPHDGPRVRLMNLHKAKGLEAPVVFLAGPSGKTVHDARLHVDRSGDKVQGYLRVEEPRSSMSRSKKCLAEPFEWKQLAEEEECFQQAERHRLFYVAATRAAACLVVTCKEKQNHTNPWCFFTRHLADCESLADPGPQTVPSSRSVPVSDQDVLAAQASISSAWQLRAAPTYRVAAAKQHSLGRSARHRTGGGSRYGTEWGTVIHVLLEAATISPRADLVALARAALEEQDLPAALAEEAAATVRSVMQSELWQRAGASEQRLTEVPMQSCLAADETDGCQTILRGVIDLVFREPRGWVVVDYKSDAAARTHQQQLVQHYRPQVDTYARAWERIVGQPVFERGLLFTATGEYVVCR